MQKAALELGLQRYRVVIRLEGPGLPQAGGTRGERQRVREEAGIAGGCGRLWCASGEGVKEAGDCAKQA